MDQEKKRKVILYWERRRILWNLILIPPSLTAYWFAEELTVGVDPALVHGLGFPLVAAAFCFAAIGANLCYCFAYAVEFWVAGSSAETPFNEIGRTVLFLLGCLLGVGLALIGGQAIALSQ